MALARAEDRVVVTLDNDFCEVLAHAGATRPSVILFRIQHLLAPAFFDLLMPILQEHEMLLSQGACISVKPESVRTRHLPLPYVPRPVGGS